MRMKTLALPYPRIQFLIMIDNRVVILGIQLQYATIIPSE